MPDNRHPIIYVRGYAMTSSERDETAADPFCGFNAGSTVYRATVDKKAAAQKFVIAENQFARDTTNADRTAHVTTTLTLKACRPGCLPAGAFKGAP